jgi:hypothetical protein
MSQKSERECFSKAQEPTTMEGLATPAISPTDRNPKHERWKAGVARKRADLVDERRKAAERDSGRTPLPAGGGKYA